MSKTKLPQYVDDDRETVGVLIRLRAPALFLGLFLGIGISFITSRFEKVLESNVHVAFFLPFIVYIADAVGTQTEAIYSRDLKTGKANFNTYLHKELAIGLIFGVIFALFSGAVVYLWLGDLSLALSTSLAALAAIATAPLIALFVAHVFQDLHKDPAAGTGPIATVIQDVISVVIYGVIASVIIL